MTYSDLEYVLRLLEGASQRDFLLGSQLPWAEMSAVRPLSGHCLGLADRLLKEFDLFRKLAPEHQREAPPGVLQALFVAARSDLISVKMAARS